MTVTADCEFFIVRAAERLHAKQVSFTGVVNSLEDLHGIPALRNGRRFSSQIFQHPTRPNHWKVSLENDYSPRDQESNSAVYRRHLSKEYSSWSNKFKRYFFRDDSRIFRRSVRFFLGKLTHQLFNTTNKNPHQDFMWGSVPGVNFEFFDGRGFVCRDYGGIYEDYLTTSTRRYPSQVATDLYTSSLAAYLFHYCHRRLTRGSNFLDARRAAGEYHRNFYDYCGQRLEFDHREFKYAALKLAYGDEIASKFDGWTAYDPINVLGVRWDNIACGSIYGGLIRRIHILVRLALNQEQSGLLRDNHLGRAVGCNCLTYHQFCLFGLTIGGANRSNRFLDRIIDKAVRFSISLQLSDGEVSYYGRGANNIYHLAAFIATLIAHRNCDGYKYPEPIKRSLSLLINHQERDSCIPGDKILPTALNACDVSDMVGWHGSPLQYEAQSAFLLARALDVDYEAKSTRVRMAKPPSGVSMRAKPFFSVMSSLGDVRLIGSEGGDLRLWNGGAHAAGYGGVVALEVLGKNRLAVNEKIGDKLGHTIVLSDFLPTKHSRLTYSAISQGHRLSGNNKKVTYMSQGNSIVIDLEFGKGTEGTYCLWFRDDCQLELITKNLTKLTFGDGVSLLIKTSIVSEVSLGELVRGCSGYARGVYFKFREMHAALNLFTERGCQ